MENKYVKLNLSKEELEIVELALSSYIHLTPEGKYTELAQKLLFNIFFYERQKDTE